MKARFIDVMPQRTAGKITILPVEVHYSKRTVSNGFRQSLFNKLIKRLQREPDTYVVFVGDLIDADRPSLRNRLSYVYAESDRKEAQSEADDYHRKYLESGIIKELRPIKHKILGAVDGDHFVFYQNGKTSTQHIMETLGIPDAYLGRRMGWVVLRIKRVSNASDVTAFKIFVRHGKGSSTTIGTDMNALIKQSTGFIADLYVGGHTHKKWVHSAPFLDVDRNGKIIEKQIAWARAGSLLKGFLEGQTTYAEESEYSPIHVGYPDVYVCLGSRNSNIAVTEIKGMI